jgi:hypothetical protein
MVIGSLGPISVEGVIRELRWGIATEGGKALSSHHIWMFIPPTHPSVCKATSEEGGYRYLDVRTDGWMDKRTDGQTDRRTE